MAHICLVTHIVTPWDGQGRVNYELAHYLARRDHVVTLVATDVAPQLLREAGIRWIRIPVPKWLPDLLAWTLFALLVRVRLDRGELGEFDIVHVHGALAPIKADVNTSHFVHGAWRRLEPKHTGRSFLARAYQHLVTAVCAFFERLAYADAQAVVAVSDAVANQLAADAGVARPWVRVIYNGVDPVEFRPRTSADRSRLRDSLELPEGAFLSAFIGDAKSPRKNLDLALQTLTQLDPRFHLVVIGDAEGGPYPALASRLRVHDRTHFLGSRHDVAACLRDADAVLCVSHYEPASLVLLEAMATGLPVICTPGVGNAAFVAHGQNGFMLDSSTDAAGAARTLTLLAGDRRLRQRVGAAARATAERVAWERMGRQYEELYRELLARRRKPATLDDSSLLTGAVSPVERRA